MKNYFIIFTIITLLASCSSKKLSPSETVTKYFQAFDNSDFNQIKTVINDSITITSGDYKTSYSQDSFYEKFKWDSVFQPTYKIIKLENKNDQILATVASSSLRFKFLKNNPLICKYKISFQNEKISKLEELEYPGADWNVWQKERDSLVKWIHSNHPKLDGFINDLTMHGAQNYLKAIELYKNRNL